MSDKNGSNPLATPAAEEIGVPKSLQGRNREWDLAKLGIKMSPMARILPWLVEVPVITITLVALTVLFSTVLGLPWTSHTDVGGLQIGDTIGSVSLPEPLMKPGELLTVVFAGLSIAFGFQQWRDARKEASLEKHYERLDLANRRMEAIYANRRTETTHACRRSDEVLPIGRQQDILRFGLSPGAMWVYTELDNLEYVIKKYELGYVQADLMKRALGYFNSLCRGAPQFAHTALVGVDPLSGSGYSPVTKGVVRKISSALGIKT